jgi:nucleotide-binding universal stress UspA family protein
MNDSALPGVIVGIDSSPRSRHALDWSAAEADLRGVPLRIVHATGPAPLTRSKEQSGEPLLRAAHELVHQAEARVRLRHRDLVVHAELRSGPAVRELVGRAREADVLVVGARGHNRLSSALLGSVSLALAAHAPCPLVVVTGALEEASPVSGPAATVILGAAPDEAPPPFEFAFAEAARRGATLRVIRAWQNPPAYPGIVDAPQIDGEARFREEASDLAEQLEAGHKAFPEVRVVAEVVCDEADAALVDASAEGGLVVLGAERHRDRLTMPLGPITHRVLHHAHCPVAVVPYYT